MQAFASVIAARAGIYLALCLDRGRGRLLCPMRKVIAQAGAPAARGLFPTASILRARAAVRSPEPWLSLAGVLTWYGSSALHVQYSSGFDLPR